jgi:uncharacterized protein (DUF1330 family)
LAGISGPTDRVSAGEHALTWRKADQTRCSRRMTKTQAEGLMRKGYIYAEFEVTDAGAWEKYVLLSQASLAGFGARNVFGRGGREILEGDLGRRRISLLEFESPEEARRWYYSPEYQAAIATRLTAAKLTALLLSGP